MEYRVIGKTGMKASVIGLGAEHLDNQPYEVVAETVHAALDSGMNIIDVFMPGEEVRQNIGRALKGKRDQVLIQGHIGSVDLKQQYDISRDLPTCRRYFENLLRDLQTDYIDFGMMFFIDSEEDYAGVFQTDFVHYVKELKREGIIRSIGASSHNPIMARRVVETGVVDLLMFSINPAFDMMPAQDYVLDTLDTGLTGRVYTGIDPVRSDLYRLCEQQETAITVMKTLGAGKLLSAAHTPFAKPLTVAQCVHYALTRPAVVSALLGLKSRSQVEEAVKYFSLREEEKDYSEAISAFNSSFRGSCVYCNHCLPCPAEIDIAAVTKYLDIAKLDSQAVPPSIRQHYGALKAQGSDCIACGQCQKRCPFSVEIIANMAEAAQIFGK